MEEKLPPFLRPGCSRLGDMAICILFGGLLGFALSFVYLHVGAPALSASRLTIYGKEGSITLQPNGLTMYGEDYSQAILHFRDNNGNSPPILEIRDKSGAVKFRSSPE
jgi:hypothetical protein